MTTIADIRRTFSVRGIDPDQLTQTPPDSHGTPAFVLTTPDGTRVWFAPLERAGWRIGWHYLVTAHGALVEHGRTDSTIAESVLPVLHRLTNRRAA